MSVHSRYISPPYVHSSPLQVQGCTDSTATNYLAEAEAERNPSECTWPIYGCTVATNTLNFDSTATVLAGCVYVQPGCTDSTATNYAAIANTDDGTCAWEIFGCVQLCSQLRSVSCDIFQCACT